MRHRDDLGAGGGCSELGVADTVCDAAKASVGRLPDAAEALELAEILECPRTRSGGEGVAGHPVREVDLNDVEPTILFAAVSEIDDEAREESARPCGSRTPLGIHGDGRTENRYDDDEEHETKGAHEEPPLHSD
jgi:hypothetical protein